MRKAFYLFVFVWAVVVLSLLAMAASPRIKSLTVTYDDGTVEQLTPPQAAAPAPVPVITASRVEVMAGLPVHVHGLSSTLGAGEIHQATFAWDFGDPHGRFNNLRGFNAAHLYDTPGTYTIKLTVTNSGGSSATASQVVTVAPARVNAIARLADARSGCRNVLTVPVVELASTWWPKLVDATVEGMPGKGTTLLYTGRDANAGIVSLPREAQGLVLRGLTFDCAVGRPGVVRAVGVYQQLASLAVVDCVGLRLESFVKSESKMASGLLIQGCSAPLVDGISGYFAWVSCSDAVIIGNTVANVTREHVVRMGYYQRVLISQNDFANLDRRPQDPADLSKGCIVCQRGSYVWITGNRCHFGGIGIGPLGGPDGLSDAGGSTQWAVVGNNTVDGGNAIQVLNGSAHVVVRDNVIDRGMADLSGVEVEGVDPAYPQRVSRDLTIVDNRQLTAGGSAPAVKIGAGVEAINNDDNLLVDPQAGNRSALLSGKGANR